jgi:1,2-phenylacetyl-CoA epoxidase catalytic subunit
MRAFAETAWVTHGYRRPLVRWLAEHGRQALALETRLGEPEAEAREEADA